MTGHHLYGFLRSSDVSESFEYKEFKDAWDKPDVCDMKEDLRNEDDFFFKLP